MHFKYRRVHTSKIDNPGVAGPVTEVKELWGMKYKTYTSSYKGKSWYDLVIRLGRQWWQISLFTELDARKGPVIEVSLIG